MLYELLREQLARLYRQHESQCAQKVLQLPATASKSADPERTFEDLTFYLYDEDGVEVDLVKEVFLQSISPAVRSRLPDCERPHAGRGCRPGKVPFGCRGRARPLNQGRELPPCCAARTLP